MIPDISKELAWLKKNSTILNDIRRGLERETLRILPDGSLSQTPFPKKIGSPLTHSWITTDFAESMLEFITPVYKNIDEMMIFLRDLHRYSYRQIQNELIWPLSMPCSVESDDDIKPAQYGKSNEGKLKTLYREGLKNRYGAMMQIISGVHYNFSLPYSFWQAKYNIQNEQESKEYISDGYFKLIRNYYRFGWVIPYLFGASPAICHSFIKNQEKLEAFLAESGGKEYLPYATSLRLSDIGYTNDAQKQIGIEFNHLNEYVQELRKATKIKSNEYSKIGIKVDGQYRQINDNILQIENEFYAPIRPKRVPKSGETPSSALLRDGIEYIEVRSLDVNPLSPIGITEEQIRFLDLFLIWCAIAPSPEMSSDELQCAKRNWDRVIKEGRKPNQTILFGCSENSESLTKVGQNLIDDLLKVAEVLDEQNCKLAYRQVCENLNPLFEHPELTLSAKILEQVKEVGVSNFGLNLSERYRDQLSQESLQILSNEDFENEREKSLEKQYQKEQNQSVSFDEYVEQINE